MTRHRTSIQADVSIRSATPADAPSIAHLHVSSFASTYRHLPETRRAALGSERAWETVWSERLGSAGNGSTIVATSEDNVVGFVYLGASPDPDDDPQQVGQILSIHVDPASTGRGVGRMLMAEAVRALQAYGYRTATLWVVDSNSHAKAFYERLGWRQDGGRRRQRLSIEGDAGDEVEIVRYRLPLSSEEAR